MKMAYKYNDEQPMTRMTCRDEYGNADIIGLEDVMHEFMLSLDYPNMVHLTEALNRFADLEESKTEALQEQKTGKWIPVDSFSAYGGDQIMWEIRGNPVAFHYCSECKEQAYANEDGDEILSGFCPCCGARMVGEEE